MASTYQPLKTVPAKAFTGWSQCLGFEGGWVKVRPCGERWAYRAEDGCGNVFAEGMAKTPSHARRYARRRFVRWAATQHEGLLGQVEQLAARVRGLEASVWELEQQVAHLRRIDQQRIEDAAMWKLVDLGFPSVVQVS